MYSKEAVRTLTFRALHMSHFPVIVMAIQAVLDRPGLSRSQFKSRSLTFEVFMRNNVIVGRKQLDPKPARVFGCLMPGSAAFDADGCGDNWADRA